MEETQITILQLPEEQEKERGDTRFGFLEELPDDVLYLVLEYVYLDMDHDFPSLKWKDLINQVLFLSKRMMTKVIIFAQNIPVCISMLDPVSVMFGCKYKLCPNTLVLVGKGPMDTELSRYLLETLDLSCLRTMCIASINDPITTGTVTTLSIVDRLKNGGFINDGDLENNIELDDFEDDIGVIIASALEENGNIGIEQLIDRYDATKLSFDLIAQTCSNTLKYLDLKYIDLNGATLPCPKLKALVISIHKDHLCDGNETLLLPTSLEHLSITLEGFFFNSEEKESIETMKPFTTCIKRLPNLKTLSIEATGCDAVTLDIQSDSLEKLELPETFNDSLDIGRCICPSLKEISLEYNEIVKPGVEGDGDDLVDLGFTHVPQVLWPLYKKEMSESNRIEDADGGITTFFLSTKRKLSENFQVSDDCVAKFVIRFDLTRDDYMEDEEGEEDFTDYFNRDSDDEGDFFSVSWFLTSNQGFFH
jgi:hypothetical protein